MLLLTVDDIRSSLVMLSFKSIKNGDSSTQVDTSRRPEYFDG